MSNYRYWGTTSEGRKDLLGFAKADGMTDAIEKLGLVMKVPGTSPIEYDGIIIEKLGGLDVGPKPN